MGPRAARDVVETRGISNLADIGDSRVVLLTGWLLRCLRYVGCLGGAERRDKKRKEARKRKKDSERGKRSIRSGREKEREMGKRR
jgi:hypothetical protein